MGSGESLRGSGESLKLREPHRGREPRFSGVAPLCSCCQKVVMVS